MTQALEMTATPQRSAQVGNECPVCEIPMLNPCLISGPDGARHWVCGECYEGFRAFRFDPAVIHRADEFVRRGG